MILSGENADFIVDMSCVSEVIDTYNKTIHRLNHMVILVSTKSHSLTAQEWSGEGRDSYNQKIDEWKNEMLKILKQLNQTRDCLNCLLEEADVLRKKAEQMKSAVI